MLRISILAVLLAILSARKRSSPLGFSLFMAAINAMMQGKR
jgi:hypothetical protein